jgi:DNA-binding LytR/AlgR family response regulator
MLSEGHPAYPFKFIKGNGKNEFLTIDLNDILYIEADRNYIEIYTINEKKRYVLRMGINHIENELDTNFIRINKSVIVSKNYISRVEANTVIVKDGKEFPVGAIYRNNFLNFIHENLLQ